ncbi:MAG: efflux RND transporter permease subunit, partial [Bacteroidales bacterium]|nr:efflux RND transporter permease subunit [Candidatus Colimorpha onthohippi]
MTLKYFIDRPVLSGVISLTIVALGILAFFQLPLERYPDIAPPSVSVTAVYPGAKAETVQKSVIAPIEEAINGIEHVSYITSTANNDGVASITVFFHQGTDADMAAVNVQNRISAVSGLLPAEVVKAGVVTQKQINTELKTMMLYAPEGAYPIEFIDNYMNSYVVPKVQRLPGVSRVHKFGSE